MVGLLYALPNTQLTRRLAREGRLHVGHDAAPEGTGDQCTAGVNYETKRSRLEILRDYRQILDEDLRSRCFLRPAGAARRRCSIARAGARNCPKAISGAAEHHQHGA